MQAHKSLNRPAARQSRARSEPWTKDIERIEGSLARSSFAALGGANHLPGHRPAFTFAFTAFAFANFAFTLLWRNRGKRPRGIRCRGRNRDTWPHVFHGSGRKHLKRGRHGSSHGLRDPFGNRLICGRRAFCHGLEQKMIANRKDRVDRETLCDD